LTQFGSKQLKIWPGIRFECVKIYEITLGDRKIPYNTQWQIFPREYPQWRNSELIEYSVGLPAATLKGNTPSQTLVCLLHSLATLVSSQPTSCFAHELPFSVAKQAGKLRFQLKLCKSPLGEFPIKIFH
jgi:hypothetical protein